MEPILKTVAQAYTERYGSLKKFCFVFPNKRCGIFFEKFLKEFGLKPGNFPEVLDISRFMVKVSGKKEAGRIEQLFTLYNCYTELLKSHGENDKNPVEFEEFRSWGEIVISDFNTVDFSMANPSEIFKNVKDIREISSNYLTDDQKDVMREYFGVEDFDNSEKFWKTFEDPTKLTDLKKSFLNLWQVMGELHERFIKSMKKRGVLSPGAIYKTAAEKIKEKGKSALRYKKLVMVGFNALTESERIIFSSLRDEEGYDGLDSFIDFIWDSTGPILKSENFSASKYVDYNKKLFPTAEWIEAKLEEKTESHLPEITVISSPSNTAQTKIAGEILKEYDNEEGRRMLQDSEVALVLPDETLLSDTLFSLPDGLDNVNITMGFSLRQSSIAAFVYLLRRVYASMREAKNYKLFFVKDLRMLLSHPYSYILFGNNETEALLEYLDIHRLVGIKDSELKEIFPSGELITEVPSKKSNDDSIFRFMEKLLGLLIEKITEKGETETNSEDIAEITIYSKYLSDLERTMQMFEIRMSPLGILHTIDRLLSSAKIGFEGEPLSGLQIMGTLETRSLDFRHVIIMSMNEGVMPRKSMTSTFIPESLRKAYGLPPARYSEEIFSYYFYRLLSRAEKVTLIYDGRIISGMKNGESRYLLQLKEYIPSSNLKKEIWKFPLKTQVKERNIVAKDKEVLDLLEAFSSDDKNKKNFSASTLNNYRECQVKFFFQNVLNLSTTSEKTDYMDPITVGNILHESMMDLYIPDTKLQRRLLTHPIIISEAQLESLLKHPGYIRALVEKKIRKHYYHEQDEKKEIADSGVINLMAIQITEFVKTIIDYDKRYAPFLLYGCEVEKKFKVTLPSGREVNFRFAIDRLDKITINGRERLRIVDYKTGARKRSAKDLDEVFGGNYKSEQLFQLFTYAWLLEKLNVEGCEDVITEIYYVPDLLEGGRGLPEINKKEVESYSSFRDEFSSRLEEMIEEIFLNEEFLDSTNVKQCQLCDFRSLCSKG